MHWLFLGSSLRYSIALLKKNGRSNTAHIREGVHCIGAWCAWEGSGAWEHSTLTGQGLHHGDGAENMRKGDGAPLRDSSGKRMAAGVCGRVDRACVSVPT